jgi:hypothetical protein
LREKFQTGEYDVLKKLSLRGNAVLLLLSRTSF